MSVGTRALRPAVIGVLLLLATSSMVAAADDAVWAAIRTSGAVVVLRHSYAPGAFDPPDARLDDCATQRNLDDNGRAQARRIGEAFRRQDIAVGAVLSSPRCRCLDTARLAFGKVEAWDVLQGSLSNAERRQAQLVEMRRRIAAQRDGPLLVLVTHGSVVTDLTGRDIRMGELVVLRREADGTHAVAGQLYID
jgi:broad specificity phosphatase PhoE